jgi:hypothetical protein
MSVELGAKPARRTHWLVWPFALIGLLGILAMIFIAFVLFGTQRNYQPAKIAGAAPDVTFTVANAREVRGTNLLHMDIAVTRGGGGSSAYSGRQEDIRNILLLDKASGASRKLLPDNGRRIASSHYFSAKGDLVDQNGFDALEAGPDEPGPPFEYYALTVEVADDSGRVDLLVGELRTGKQAYIMSGLDGIDAMWTHGPTQLGFLVRERLGLYHRIVDIPTLKVIQSKRIVVD